MKKYIKNIFVLFIITLVITNCSFNNSSSDLGNSGEETSSNISTPIISPASGDYTEGFKEISISCATTGVDIFYSTNGDEPTLSSNRYVGPFKIIGSKTVKAIAIKGNSKSSITSASFTLNAGKTQSQLGVVTGTVNLSYSLSEEDRAELSDATIWIYCDDIPSVVKTCKLGESFYFDGLDTSKSYSFFFSNVEPNVIQGTKNARAATEKHHGTARDENGKPLVAKKVDVTPAEGAGVEVPVDLSATGIIKGIVKRYDVTGTEEVDHGGTVVYIPGTSYSAYTDEAGNFSMSGVPQGSHTIRAQYAGYSFVEKSNIIIEAKDENIPETVIEEEFSLAFGKGIVSGSVVFGDLTEANKHQGISIILTDITNSYSYTAQTKSNGSYSITDVYPGTYNIEIFADGYESILLSDIVVVGAKVTTIPTASLQVIGGSISGTANIDGKTDLSGISILAKNDTTGKSFFAITDSLGNFAWDCVSPGSYTISSSYPGYCTSSISGIEVTIGSKIENIVIPTMKSSTYSITGRVVLEGMSSNFEGTDVLIKDSATLKTVASTITTIDGSYTVSELQTGSYLIEVSRQGFITSNSIVVNVGSNPIESVESIVLKNSQGSVKGYVKLEGTTDYSGINILLSSEENENTTYSTITDAEGYYSLSGIIPGKWRIQATKSGFNTGFSDPFSVNSGLITETSTLELKISLRSIFGEVELEGRTDYSGVKITATNIQNVSEIYSALTNAQGFYALSSMKPGEYILSYSMENYRSVTSSSVSLTEDSSVELDKVLLNKATGKISGIVNLEGCTDHSGILVTLVGTDYTYTTEADGSYEFSVPSGNYPGGVRFYKDDYQLTAKAETIPVLTDSTYGVLTVELKAIANTVKGKTTLAGSEDSSGILVTVDGLDSNEYFATTDEHGKWELKHIPLGYQTIRFSKINVPDVTAEIEVIPCEYVQISDLEMLPDSATLKGNIYLEDMTDHQGILVTIKTIDKEDIIVRTTSDGAFVATNILASVSHEIVFSKEGWDSQSITIDDFEPLEERQIVLNKEFVLKDTTAPVINDVVINQGANFANKTNLSVEIFADEKGSLVDKMSVQVIASAAGIEKEIYPSIPSWQDYKVGFEFDLDDLPDSIYTGNGTYTLVITLKDKAGNVSESVRDSISITDVVTSLAGVLTGDNLHLVKERSPYLVEADCMVSDGTLIIDPGVEIRFAGEYSITLDEGIQAIGTEEEKIIFTSDVVDEEYTYTTTEWGTYIDENGNEQYGEHEVTKTEVGTTYWKSLNINGSSLVTNNKYEYVDGNILKYCVFEYAQQPIYAKSDVYITKCEFSNNLSPDEYGWSQYGVKLSCAFVAIDNLFDNGLVLQSSYNALFANNRISADLIIESCSGLIVQDNNFFNSHLYLRNTSVNKIFENVFESSKVCFSYGLDNNEINSNNFIDCTTPIVDVKEFEYNKNYKINLKNNFWGQSNTEELNLKGNKSNISFITDYYDDFNKAVVDYSNWLTVSNEYAGYKGDGFIAFDYTVNGYNFNEGGYYPETQETELTIGVTPTYYTNEISEIRIAQGYENILEAPWQLYTDTLPFMVDKETLVDGYAPICVQIKDIEGNLSSVVTHNIPYGRPTITTNLVDGTVYKNPTTNLGYQFDFNDDCSIYGFELYLDDVVMGSNYWSDGFGTELSIGTNNFEVIYCYNNIGLLYMNSGEHTLTAKVWDKANNITTKEITFTIERTNTSTYEGITYDKTTGEFLKDDKTVYLWHLNDSGAEVNNTNVTISGYTNAIGGLGEGCASFIYASDTIPLDVANNAFTIEYWIKGSEKYDNPYLYFDKFYSFVMYNGYVNLSYEEADRINITSFSYQPIPNDGEWHYSTLVYCKDYVARYIDGVLVDYDDTIDIELNNSDSELHISSSYLDAVDEIRISNVARSADEIAEYYNIAKEILENSNGSLGAIIY